MLPAWRHGLSPEKPDFARRGKPEMSIATGMETTEKYKQPLRT